MTQPSTTRCEKTDLLVDQCAHCKGDLSVEEQARSDGEAGPWFEASYPGACSRCGLDFDPGDTIRADGHDGYELIGCDE